jgi:hypothetical protein
MARSVTAVVLLALASASIFAQNSSAKGLSADLAATGLVPISSARETPTLSHLGFDTLLGLEYVLPQSVALRVEVGYLLASASRISPSGELYRGWSGIRIAFLGGYSIDSLAQYPFGSLGVDLLAGAAATAANYTGTALAFAYPSALVEARAFLTLRDPSKRGIVQGPWAALPLELMFRAASFSLAPGLSLGWRYRLGAIL